MPAEYITLKCGYGPAIDFFPTGVTDEWEAKDPTGDHRGFFSAEDVARAVVEAIYEGAPIRTLVGGDD